jgi:hypothetical protein
MTKPCPDCGGPVSVHADACPHCGRPCIITLANPIEPKKQEDSYVAKGMALGFGMFIVLPTCLWPIILLAKASNASAGHP